MKGWIKLALLFAICALSSPASRSQNLDLQILKNINPQYPTSDYWIQTSVSAYWLPAGYLAGSLVYGIVTKDPKEKIRTYEAVMAIGGSVALSELLKVIIQRPRPGDAYPNDIFPYRKTTDPSFPSGHTTVAFSTAANLSIRFRKWYVVVPAYLWAASVGYSRMYLGMHYPSDVLAGAALGIGSAYLAHWLSKKLFREKDGMQH